MDLKGIRKKNKNKISSDEDDNSKSKRTRPSIPTGFGTGSVAEAERYFVDQLLGGIKPLLSDLVQVEVKNAFQTHFHALLESLRERKETGEEVSIESEVEKKYKLVFCNEIGSTIFTNSEIRAENGEALRIAICDVKTNAIICEGILSSAQVELFVLDGEYGSGQQDQNETSDHFDISCVLSARVGKRPLMLGNDQKLNLENGVGSIKNLCITDNSSWMKNKKFRLGVKIIDPKILALFPGIGVAMSQPFRVMDHRGEVNKKHHPPSRDGELWRLEGIGKDGAYHKNLSLRGIKNVGDFLDAYKEMGSTSLKKLLGVKVPKKTWMMMVQNAFECVIIDPTNEQTSKANLLGNKAMGDHHEQAFNEQKNLGYGFENIPPGICFAEDFEYDLPNYFEVDPPSSLFPGETSTSYEALTPNDLRSS